MSIRKINRPVYIFEVSVSRSCIIYDVRSRRAFAYFLFYYTLSLLMVRIASRDVLPHLTDDVCQLLRLNQLLLTINIFFRLDINNFNRYECYANSSAFLQFPSLYYSYPASLRFLWKFRYSAGFRYMVIDLWARIFSVNFTLEKIFRAANAGQVDYILYYYYIGILLSVISLFAVITNYYHTLIPYNYVISQNTPNELAFDS